MNPIFCKLKKLIKHKFNVLQAEKKLKKHGFNFLQASQGSKNIN